MPADSPRRIVYHVNRPVLLEMMISHILADAREQGVSRADISRAVEEALRNRGYQARVLPGVGA